MSWEGNAMIEQEAADALNYMGEAEWRDMYGEPKKIGRPRKSDEEKKQSRKAYNAQYWAAHKEKISERRKKIYKENRDKTLARNKQWLKDNKDQWNAYQREYRRRKKAALDKQKKA